ncbi:MAG: FAD-dependent oxidoreductase [Dehalococcoidia bacterium]|nr:FAD-dependent oxidoreductase [Dehalococcoidia bacterium]
MATNKTAILPDAKCWEAFQKMPPCQEACPIHMDVSRYVLAIAQGRFEDALAIIRETNPLASACGRICNHPCESVCTRGKVDDPIAIEWLKRVPGDLIAAKSGEKTSPVERRWPEQVAVVGAGPAGLTAAADLAKMGYAVTVFEELPVAGGMLAYGVPEFALDRKALQRDIDHIKGLGVEIKTNHALGPNLTINDLKQMGYKSILIAVGAQSAMKLPLPGSDLQGIFHGLPFIKDASLGKAPKISGKVGVIGGGNVAIDAARVALRLGASEVHLTCLESRKEMPAFSWEIERAVEEGIKLHPSRAPKQIAAKDGKVAGLDLVECKELCTDYEGRIKPVLNENIKESLAVDAVIIAIGQTIDQAFAAGAPKLQLGKRGEVSCDPETLATNLDGVYVAGDAVVVRGTVVESMAAGRKAAQTINRHLRGLDLAECEIPPAAQEIADSKVPKWVESRKRQSMPTLPVKDRSASFKEVDLGFQEKEAVAEARRCLTCDVCGNCMFDRAQVCYQTGSRLL